MELSGKVAIVTGGAGGIGRALAHRFVEEGAAGVALVDLDADRAAAAAAEIGDGAIGLGADVSVREEVARAVDEVEAELGPVDLFCANAGIATGVGIEADDEVWDRTWRVNVLAHVHAAREMVPRWLQRGGGYLLTTASAAGLLSNIGDGPYSATKHAAVGLAEWLSITYGDRGIGVSCLCPQGVRTDMLLGGAGHVGAEAVLAQGAIEPEAVAAAVVAGLAAERFLILPHPEVAEHVRRKAADHDRWLGGMRRLQSRVSAALDS